MRYKQTFFGLILFILLVFFLQITSKFHFFYIEQLQLFQFSGDYLADKISYPGGLSSVIGEFLTQFFITPYLGPIIFAALLTGIGLTMRKTNHPGKRIVSDLLTPRLILIIGSIRFQLLTTRNSGLFNLPTLFEWVDTDQ